MSKGAIYKEIAKYLRKEISGGKLKIGDAVYSENLLCERFKVSRTSVRKAIRQMVDENLLISRQGLGTFVKSSGHGIMHNSICMLNHWLRLLRYDYTDAYYMDMVYGAEEATNRKGLNFQLYSGCLTGEEDVAEKMAHVKVDGALIDGAYQNKREPDFLTRLTPHAVLIDGNPGETDFPSVAPAGTPAFQKLLKLASERGGTTFFLHEDHHAQNRWRLQCFRQAAEKFKGLPVIYVNYAEKLTGDNFINLDHFYLISHALRNAMEASKDCRSIICDSDHTAVKALNYLKKNNFSIPGDIAISGFSGIAFSSMTQPQLTTVRVDSRKMAETAINFLIEQIEGKSKKRINLTPTRLLRRGSF